MMLSEDVVIGTVVDPFVGLGLETIGGLLVEAAFVVKA
jgi:hypothetical protein